MSPFVYCTLPNLPRHNKDFTFSGTWFPNHNMHHTVYVVTPEFNFNNQMIFRDNLVPAIKGKNVVLLLATTTKFLFILAIGTGIGLICLITGHVSRGENTLRSAEYSKRKGTSMESKVIKFYSKAGSNIVLRAIPGHFATSHSHINYYADMVVKILSTECPSMEETALNTEQICCTLPP